MADQSPIFRLPTELVQHIASLLFDDDLCSLSRTCVAFAAQVLPPNSSVWRTKFEDQYDSVEHHTSEELKFEYQTRALVLSQVVSFRHGETEQGYLWLEVLQTMLQEALLYTGSGDSLRPLSKNMERIAEVIEHSDFLSRPITGYGEETVSEPSRLFCTIQLCLTHLSFNTRYARPCSQDDYKIEYVYSYASLYHIPLVVQGKVDLKTLLHIRNFWQRHFTSPMEDTFFTSYQSITERPDTWSCPFEQRDTLKTFWLGFYSCIHPYPGTAKDLKASQTCAKFGEHATGITCAISINLEIDNNPQNWPQLINDIIPMSADCPRRVFFRGLLRNYNSTESSAFDLVRGFLEPIADPQGGIPGWTRICFVSYDANRDVLGTFVEEGDEQTAEQNGSTFPDEDWPPADFEWSFHSIYGFEGVILPGDRIMLGQWLDIQEEGALDCSRGPLICWDA